MPFIIQIVGEMAKAAWLADQAALRAEIEEKLIDEQTVYQQIAEAMTLNELWGKAKMLSKASGIEVEPAFLFVLFREHHTWLMIEQHPRVREGTKGLGSLSFADVSDEYS